MRFTTRNKRPADMRPTCGSFAVAASLLGLALVAGSCASVPGRSSDSETSQKDRLEILRRAQVWSPTNIPAMDLKTGPMGLGAFARGAVVRCDYVERRMSGRSPKFMCIIPGKEPDEVKVKYGQGNAEVYGEVMSTRLLWALGFGADRMYPVRVICRGCPASMTAGTPLPSGERLFDPAVIERKTTGREIESTSNQGWSWQELDLVDAAFGGAPKAHRDALKLLAVVIKHSDSKPAQQRLICLDQPLAGPPSAKDACEHPFMLIQDVGLTFGKPDLFFRKMNYVNLERWSSTRVWSAGEGCVGNIDRPFLGTLERPRISEAGRVFLATLLNQLRDSQIRDLFEAARVSRRPEGLAQEPETGTAVEDWVTVFKRKRQEVDARRCPADPPKDKG